jgi:hypothetical protein
MRFISNQGGETVRRVYSRRGDWGRAEAGKSAGSNFGIACSGNVCGSRIRLNTEDIERE